MNQAHEPVCKSYVWLPDDQYFRKQQASIVQSRMTAWFFRDQTNRTNGENASSAMSFAVLITDPPQIAKRQDEPSLNTKAVLNCRLRLGRQVKRLDHKIISLMTGLLATRPTSFRTVSKKAGPFFFHWQCRHGSGFYSQPLMD